MATAEALTGGRLADLLGDAGSASPAYVGGVVTPTTSSVTSLLGLADQPLRRDGLVSATSAAAMAEQVRLLAGATWGVATTGVTGPAEVEGRAPGTVLIAVAGASRDPVVRALELTGARDDVVARACEEALTALLEALRSLDPGTGTDR